MMRVLMLHNDYMQEGGEYHSTRAEANALRAGGAEVEFVSMDNSDVVGQGGNRAIAIETMTSGRARRLLDDALHRFSPHIVHAQNLFPLMSGSIDVLRRHGVPWVRTLRNYRTRCLAGTCFRDGEICTDCASARRGLPGVVHGCYRGSRAASAVALGYALQETRFAAAHPPRAYILLSEAMRGLLSSSLDPSAAVYIKPNSVPGSTALVPLPRVERDEEFLFVGRMAPEKGVSDIIRSFARTDLRLTLIGDGELDADDARIARDSPNIRLTGRLPRDEVFRRMERALATIVPSRWAEPFGRVAAESLAAATPPLVSGVGGLEEIPRGLAGGRLVVPPELDWAVAARDLRAMPPHEYDQLTAECHARWESTYEEGALNKRLLRIYESALSPASGAGAR